VLTGCRSTSPSSNSFTKNASSKDSNPMSYQDYLDFFDEVYEVMQDNYYKPLTRESYNSFVENFRTKIYAQLQDEGKSNNYVKWRSTAYLVDHLKTSEDVVSAFFPPKPAKEYEKKVLGRRMGLGIDGEIVELGFKATHVEPRSDAYSKGLRINDVLTKIDDTDLKVLEEKEINQLLIPFIDTQVKLTFLDSDEENQLKIIEVLSKEFFQQMIFDVPVAIPNIYCLELTHFNRKTAEDMFRFLDFYRQQGPIKGLIIDLRGNPGGPPLAAREISSFFSKRRG